MPNVRRRTNVACIGLGWVSTNRHIPAIRRNPNLNLVGVVDRRPGRALKVANELGISRHSEAASLDQIGWLDEVEAVAVGTPPGTHYELISEALGLGKHVLTEKPFVMSVSEGELVLAAARKAERTVTIVHNFQFADSFKALERDLKSGRLGNIRSISGVQMSNPSRRLPQWYESLPFGLFYDESPHLLYLLRRLCGNNLELNSASGYFRSPQNTPEVLSAELAGRLEDGRQIPVGLYLNFVAPLSEWYVLVYGDDALGVVDLFRDVYLRLPNDGAHEAPAVLRTSLSASWQHWRQVITRGISHLSGRLVYGNDIVFERFARAVSEGVEQPSVSSQDALDVVRLQHAIIIMMKAAKVGTSDDYR